MRFLTFLLVLFLVFPNLIIGQISFYEIYSGNGYDKGCGIVQLEDSSYMITGNSSSFQNNSQAFLLHIDSIGNYIWSNNYGGIESDVAKRVLYQQGFGFFIAGTTNSFGNGAYDALLMKIDNNGLLEWEKSYGSSGWDQINDAVLTRDTGVVLVGQIFDSLSQSMNIYIVRTNKFGDTIWTKNIGDQGDDQANSIIRVEDSLYVIGGSVFISDSSFEMGYVLKIDDLGNILWSDTIGESYGPYEINDLVEVPLGINVIGCRYDNVLNSGDNYTARFDLNGNLLYEDTYQSPGNTILDQIGINGNQNSLFIGYRYIDGTSFQDGYDIALARFTFNLFWDNHSMALNNPMEEKIEQIIPTSDGGLIVVGFNNYPINGGNNIFVLKVDSNDVFPSTSVAPTIIPIVDIKDIELNTITVCPNPFSNYIKIDVAEPCDIYLYDQYGKKIEKWNISKFALMNLSHLDSGIYYLYSNLEKLTGIRLVKM